MSDEEKNLFITLLNKKRKLLELREVVKSKSPRNQLNDVVDEKDAFCPVFSNEVPSISPPPFSPLTPLAHKSKQNIENKLKDTFSPKTVFSNEVPSISPPPFSPLTPLAHKSKQNIENKLEGDLISDTLCGISSLPESPRSLNNDPISSPLRPMSPETRELFNSLVERDLDFENPPSYNSHSVIDDSDINHNIKQTVKNDSETDCESCDDVQIVQPKMSTNEIEMQKKKSDVNTKDDVHTCTQNEKDRLGKQKVMSHIDNIEENKLQESTASTSDMNTMAETRSENTTITTVIGNTMEEGTKKINKGRSRKEREASKRLRNSGQCYITEKGKKVEERQLGSLRTCRLKCVDRFSEIERKHCFDKYWALGSRDRRAMYIASLITILPKKTQKTDSRTLNRDCYCKYKLLIDGEEKPICKECFRKTFGETKGFINIVIEKKKNSPNGIIPVDTRGRQPSKNKKCVDDINSAKNHILSFPNYESHYCRKRTNKKYLSSDLSIAAMYRLYKEVYTNPVSLKLYAQCFHDLNLSFKKPSKDTCHTCDLLNMKISLAEGQEKFNLKVELDEHQSMAEKAYSEKRRDKEAAKGDSTIRAYAFDLQQCLPTPYLKTSVSFYKRQLWSFNLTIHDLADDKAICYMWDETISGRGANQIASCLWHFLRNLPPDVKQVTFYSDTCGGQNKNNTVAMMFMLLLHLHPTLEIINHKFLISGHTHMECDSDHAIIERTKKKTKLKINHLNDWIQLVRSCKIKNGFDVVPMKLEQFYNFTELSTKKGPFVLKKKDNSGAKFLWQPVKWLQYKKPVGEIYFKTDLDIESSFRVINFKKRGKCNLDSVQLDNVSKEYLSISKEKKKDLMALLPLIDPAFHEFYKNIKSDSESSNIDPDLDTEDPDLEEN